MRTTYSSSKLSIDQETRKVTPGKKGKKTGEEEKEGRKEVRRQQGPPSRRGASERPRPRRERTWPILGGADRLATPETAEPSKETSLEGRLQLDYEDLESRNTAAWSTGSSGTAEGVHHPTGAVWAGRLGPLDPSPRGGVRRSDQ